MDWDRTGVHVQLLGDFVLFDGVVEVPITPAGQRIVAFLALRRASDRDVVASQLWINQARTQAGACLRSALWRLPRLTGGSLVQVVGNRLRLRPDVRIDLTSRREVAENLAGARCVPPGVQSAMFTSDLLPSWPDDWLIIERERYRQLRLHALERLSEAAAQAGSFATAIEAGLCAVAAEPLRESAHSCVIRAHLGEGNRQEATRQALAYVAVLQEAGLPVDLPSWIANLLEHQLNSARSWHSDDRNVVTGSKHQGVNHLRPVSRSAPVGMPPRLDHGQQRR